MKNVANSDMHRDLQRVEHRMVFERELRWWDIPATILAVLHYLFCRCCILHHAVHLGANCEDFLNVGAVCRTIHGSAVARLSGDIWVRSPQLRPPRVINYPAKALDGRAHVSQQTR